jgi:6-phosphogluconolactonase
MNQLALSAFGLTLSLIVGVVSAGCQSQNASNQAATADKEVAVQSKKLAELSSGPCTVFIGTYTRAKSGSQGIYTATFDPKTGALSAPQLAAEAKDPSFVAISPDKKVLYSVAEVEDLDGQKGGGVLSFSIDGGGKLKQISQISSGGPGPCYVSVDATGRNVFAANYSGGSISRSVNVDGNGKLEGPMATINFDEPTGPNKARQDKNHAHMITADPTNSFVLATDLGSDLVHVYRLDPLKGIVPSDPPTTSLKAGAGPRHFAFHPGGKFVFVIAELDSTITSFAWNGTEGTLKAIDAVSTLPADFKGESTCAHIMVHPSGKYVYGSNRGHDSIACFSVDEKTGKLTSIGHTSTGGKTPRNFNIDPTGNYLIAANQNSNSLAVLKIDPATGKLSDTGKSVKVDAPVCVQFLTK